MKAQRLKVIKPFLTRKEGQIIMPPRQDVARSLVEQGLCEWVIVENKEVEPIGNQVVGKPIIIEPKKENNDNSDISRSAASNGGKQSSRTNSKRRGRKSSK